TSPPRCARGRGPACHGRMTQPVHAVNVSDPATISPMSLSARRSLSPLAGTSSGYRACNPDKRHFEGGRQMSTYLLVHGAWHGAWCWYKIIPRLQAAGHKVIALDMPGHGRDWRPPGEITMQDYVDTITRALDAEAEPAVLVAHSRGGLVATHAAEA